MYTNNMKNLFQLFKSHMTNPTGYDVIVAVFVTVIFGNMTGEIVSRDYNSYFQAIMLLGTLALTIVSVRMIGVWVINYITNKNK